jgi:hypothetical protein
VFEYSIRDFFEAQNAGAYGLLRHGSVMTSFLGDRVLMFVRRLRRRVGRRGCFVLCSPRLCVVSLVHSKVFSWYISLQCHGDTAGEASERGLENVALI